MRSVAIHSPPGYGDRTVGAEWMRRHVMLHRIHRRVAFNFDDPHHPLVGKALPIWGMMAYYERTWDKKRQWATTIGYSRVSIDNGDAQAVDAFRIGQYGGVTLLHYPGSILSVPKSETRCAEMAPRIVGIGGKRTDRGTSVGRSYRTSPMVGGTR